jgi:hypothetical protein
LEAGRASCLRVHESDAEEENMAAKRSRWQDVGKSEIPVKQLRMFIHMSNKG